MISHFKPALLLAAAVAFGVAAPAHAQAPSAGGGSPAATAIPKAFTKGEVRKLDKAGRKITLKHDEITNLGMPPMAMVFEVKDARLLDNLKVGDKVRFKAVHEAGNYVLVDLQRAK